MHSGSHTALKKWLDFSTKFNRKGFLQTDIKKMPLMILINNNGTEPTFFNLFCLDESPLTNFQWKQESDYCTVKHLTKVISCAKGKCFWIASFIRTKVHITQDEASISLKKCIKNAYFTLMWHQIWPHPMDRFWALLTLWKRTK